MHPTAAFRHPSPPCAPAARPGCADQHHAPERRVGRLAAEPLHRRVQRLPQQQGGIRDRIAGGVGEEPELEVLADARVCGKVVHHVRPAERARRVAADQHHRHAAAPMRLQRGEPFIAPPPHNPTPHPRGLIELQRHSLPADAHRLGVEDGVDGEGAAQRAAGELLPRLGDLEQRRARNAQPRRDLDAPHRCRWRRDARGHGRADAGHPVLVLQALHRQGGGGLEQGQRPAARAEAALVDRDVDRAEGQRMAAGAEGRRATILRTEHRGEGQVIEIGCLAQARVQGLGPVRRSGS